MNRNIEAGCLCLITKGDVNLIGRQCVVEKWINSGEAFSNQGDMLRNSTSMAGWWIRFQGGDAGLYPSHALIRIDDYDYQKETTIQNEEMTA